MVRRRKSWKLKYAIVAAALVAAAAAIFIYRGNGMEYWHRLTAPAPVVTQKQVGYKAEDRHKLEQLINTDAKND